MRDQNLSCLVEQLLRDRAGRLAGRRFANGATGPIAGRGARELPECLSENILNLLNRL
jgi:hypothetical protein